MELKILRLNKYYWAYVLVLSKKKKPISVAEKIKKNTKKIQISPASPA